MAYLWHKETVEFKPERDMLSHCGEQARLHDPDRALSALFAPEPARAALLALLAFNAEIERVPRMVREPILGQIRIQWWRDALAGLYGAGAQVSGHPVLDELAAAIAAFALSRAHFDMILDAREGFDFAERRPGDPAGCVDHADATAGALMRLGLEVLGLAGDPAASEAGGGVARAHALAGMIHDPPTGVDALSLVRAAREHLAAARALRARVPRAALPLLLPGLLVERRLEGARPSRAGRAIRLMIGHMRGRY